MTENEADIRALCRMLVGRRLEDEAFSHAAIKIQQIFNAYNENHESGASIKTYAMRNIRWYVWKKWLGPQKKKPVTLPDDCYYEDEPELGIEVNMILERLSDYDAAILRMYHLEEMTFQEMADDLGHASKCTARNHYLAAIKRARALIAEE